MSLFMPKEQKELADLIGGDYVPISERSDLALVISTNNEIFATDSLRIEPVKVGDCNNIVSGGCGYNGELYLNSKRGVFKDLDNCKVLVGSVCEGIINFEDDIYYAIARGRVFSFVDDNEVAFRDGKVKDFCEYDGKLYDCGENGIFETFTGNWLSEDRPYIHSICGFEEELYAVDDEPGFFDVFSGKRFLKDVNVNRLTSFDGSLVMSHRDWLIDSSGLEKFNAGGYIHSVFTVPKNCLGGVL